MPTNQLNEKFRRVASLALVVLIVAVVLQSVYSERVSTDIEEYSVPNSFSPHKKLFPLDSYDYLGIGLICIGLMIAASGGIGGGGIVVPLLILVLGFQPKHAVALSNFTILGSSLTNMVRNTCLANRPCTTVTYNYLLILQGNEHTEGPPQC